MSVEGHIDRQRQSRLVQLPAELKRQIYSYVVPPEAHLYRNDATIRAATCITPMPTSDYYCFDRRSHGDPSSVVWARRLTSSWGGHWRCEEVAKRLPVDTPDGHTQHDSAMALMASCRTICEDVSCFFANECVLHVNDLATLDLLFDESNGSYRSSSPDHILMRAFFHARRLNVSLRLPPAWFKAIGSNHLPPSPSSSSSPSPASSSSSSFMDTSSPSAVWIRLWRNMTTLPHLHSLDITLDHDSESSWSGVNEHAILAPLQILSRHSHINTTLNMPKVASGKDTATSHGLTTKRFTRQRYFTEYRKDGSVGLVYEEDALKLLHRPGPNAADMLRSAEMTMHIWYQGVDMDYVGMDELSDTYDGETF